MKKILSFKFLSAAFGVLAVMAFAASFTNTAEAGKRRVEVGTLTCDVSSGSNFIFGSTKSLDCDLVGVSNKVLATYRGTIKRFGIDLGKSKRTVMSWTVIAPTSDFRETSLEGAYVGVAADVALGLGGGAKVLVGGSRKTITLQPVSIQAQTGINLALTVAEMTLYAQ